MSGTIRAVAQAKVNLRLKVLALQDSGFHAIETVFLRLDLADTVTVAVSQGRGISVDVTGDPHLVVASGSPADNLAVVAAAAYCERTAWSPRIDIGIVKRIPVGAGLGGGSADAAAVLRSLNALAPRPLSGPDLMALAGDIGSDVPFLASDGVMAMGWGRGERLQSLPALPPRPVLLAIPPVAVATRDAYQWLGRTRGEAPPAPAGLGESFSSWEGAARHGFNDFSAPVASRHPVIATITGSLIARGARVAMLTGSGSTVFGVFDQGAGVEPLMVGEWRELATSTAGQVVPIERTD